MRTSTIDMLKCFAGRGSGDNPMLSVCKVLRRSLTPAVWLVAILLVIPAAGFSQTPTVNGLFYGDGDDAIYQPYAESAGGSLVHMYLDAPNSTLYVALVVDHSVNDTVCGNVEYTASAGWGDLNHDCNKMHDSEYATFTFECAPAGTLAFEWQQAFACADDLTDPWSDWWSAPKDPDLEQGDPGAGCKSSTKIDTWPPGIVASSSFVTNVNTYQDTYGYETPWPPSPAPPWDLYVNGIGIKGAGKGGWGGWKSPFVPSPGNPDVVQLVTGYPTYSTYNDINSAVDDTGGWEWSMVYEWSLDMDVVGCGNEPIYVITGESHHSPHKTVGGKADDPFDPPPDDPYDQVFSDWGDLPAAFAITESVNSGAQHYITVNGPYLGQDLQAELDGQPTSDATGDGSEEDGVSAFVTSAWTVGSTQTIEVSVANASSGALLGAWFDWDGDNTFAADEFYSLTVSNGTNYLEVVVGSDFDWSNDPLFARFRLFSSGASAPDDSLDATDFAGVATDGEVEDYLWAAGTLPVTLNAFSSEGAAGRQLTARWQTASETDNVGFELWGRVRGKWQVLGDFVPSRGMNSHLPQDYEVQVMAPPMLSELQLVDYRSRGGMEYYGPFRIGVHHGERQPVQRIDWTQPRAELEARLKGRGFQDVGGSTKSTNRDSWKKVKRDGAVSGASIEGRLGRKIMVEPTSATAAFDSQKSIAINEGPMTHIAVVEPGVQRVTYEALRDGGLDLSGVRAREIAVTWRGEPVARWVDGGGTFRPGSAVDFTYEALRDGGLDPAGVHSREIAVTWRRGPVARLVDGGGFFGPGSAIEFLARPPQGEDSLYIDANLYQVAVDREKVVEAKKERGGHVSDASPSYLKQVWVDPPNLYHSQSPTGDPWINQTALARPGSPATVTLDLPVDDEVLDGEHKLIIGLGTVTDLPDVPGDAGRFVPEHNVEVWFSGPGSDFVPVTTASISGQKDWRIEANLPVGLLEAGLNQIELRFSTEYVFSLVAIDRYGVEFATPYRGPELDFSEDRKAEGYRIEGFDSSSVVAYAEKPDGSLARLKTIVTQTGDGFEAELKVEGRDFVRFWVTDRPHTPSVFTTAAPADLLGMPADLVVIAGSAFVDTPALDDYVHQKAAFKPIVVDVEDIYNSLGYGMALPSAITDYLQARNSMNPFTHVQLVGSDCYDRLNYISECVSFIPLPSARVGPTLYSPSQNALVDLDEDGVADVAVGQFSIRSEHELATILGKESSWHTSGLSGSGSALLIAEESDGIHDFLDQVERLGRLTDSSETQVLDMALHPDVVTAREELRLALDDGRALTVFSGHSSSSVWAYRGLFTSSNVSQLTNFDTPTVMVPLACETSYDSSPSANVLGHQLLYAGEQGALAISGAVSLSGLGDNERMANRILAGLDAGLTLGEAVQAGRESLGVAYRELLDNWVTQGDVTLMMDR